MGIGFCQKRTLLLGEAELSSLGVALWAMGECAPPIFFFFFWLAVGVARFAKSVQPPHTIFFQWGTQENLTTSFGFWQKF
jgi:hypothetical protein